MIYNDLVVYLCNPLSIEEIGHLHEIHAHLLRLLEEFFAELTEVFRGYFRLGKLTIYSGSPGQFLLDGLSLFFLKQLRGDTFPLHEAK